MSDPQKQTGSGSSPESSTSTRAGQQQGQPTRPESRQERTSPGQAASTSPSMEQSSAQSSLPPPPRPTRPSDGSPPRATAGTQEAAGVSPGSRNQSSNGTRGGQTSTSRPEDPAVLEFMREQGEFLESISYDGMDPAYIRAKTREAFGDWKTLVQAMMMYVNWGSRFYNKDKKSKNEAVAAAAIASLKELGVKETKRDGKLTLARVAASHPLLLYAVRDHLFKTKKLPTSGVHVEGLYPPLADLGLACYSERQTDQGKLLKTFLEKFAIQLHDAAVADKRTVKMEDEAVLKEMNKFRMAAVSSLQNDSVNDVPLGNINITTALIAYEYMSP